MEKGRKGSANKAPKVAKLAVSLDSSPNGLEQAGTGGIFVHPDGIVEPGARIGTGTRVWAFAHVLSQATIGADCNICDHVFIENDVVIGDRVTVKSGVQLWDGVRLEDEVFVGPNATFTNDLFPRSKHYGEPVKTVVRTGASIGANATIIAGVVIGRSAMVGAGAVVTGNVPPNAIVVGNPARIVGYVSSDSPERLRAEVDRDPRQSTRVPSARLYQLPRVADLRGNLSVAEFEEHLPFAPVRYFVVYNVPSQEVRGEHAHKKLHQFLVCLHGSCSVVVDDGTHRDEVALDRPDLGLHIPPMVWATQYKYTPDAVLLVLASEKYDPDDYIRDYDAYLEEVKLLSPGN